MEAEWELITEEYWKHLIIWDKLHPNCRKTELCWHALHEIGVLMGKNGKGVTTAVWILGLKHASGLFTPHLFNPHEILWHTFAWVKFSSICMPSIHWWITAELMEP